MLCELHAQDLCPVVGRNSATRDSRKTFSLPDLLLTVMKTTYCPFKDSSLNYNCDTIKTSSAVLCLFFQLCCAVLTFIIVSVNLAGTPHFAPPPRLNSNHFAAPASNTSTTRCHLGRPPGRSLGAASSPFWCDTNFPEMLNCFETQRLFPAGPSCLTNPAHRHEPLPTDGRQRCFQLLYHAF